MKDTVEEPCWPSDNLLTDLAAPVSHYGRLITIIRSPREVLLGGDFGVGKLLKGEGLGGGELLRVQLQQDDAGAVQLGRGLGQQASHQVQTVRAAVQRQLRLLLHLGL